MNCPECGSENRDAAARCDACGLALALSAGTVLAGRYEIKDVLGAGGLGRVYRAHDRMLDERIAVKVLHPEAARSPEMSRRFRSEIKLARKVRHRHVCAIHEYGEHEGYRFVAMEIVDGVDLHRVLRERGAIPPREAFDILIQVTKGLAAIHGAGVIHRDLKTPNIMLDSRGDVRLLDFGIAKLRTPTDASAITSVQKVVGTPEYMSPEQIRGDDLDERSDIYGLGVVIYELFTGTVPFRGKSPLDTLVKHMNTPPPLYGEAISRLPPSLVPLLRRCLAKRPEERYSSARELLEALRVARNSAFPDSDVTLDGMPALDPQSAPAASPPALPGAAERPHTPPSGPPRHPIAGAPPLPSPPPSRPLPAEASPTPAEGRNLAHLGTGLAILGLLATAAAWVWQRPRAGSVEPPNSPLVPTTLRAPVPMAEKRSTLREAVPSAPLDTEPAPALPSPSPEAHVAPTGVAALPSPTTGAPEATAGPEPAPRRRRPSPSPTPSSIPAAVPVATTGTLDLELRPPASVEIDGGPPMRTPLRGVVLAAGTHIVRLSHPDFWPLTRRLSVQAGGALRLDIDLAWEAVARVRNGAEPFATPLDGSPTDPYFGRGLRQLANGDYAEALLNLDPVARRLQQASKEKELARCEFYVGVALLELNRQVGAKERFERALENDRSLRLPPASFSPKVVNFFKAVREATPKKP